MSGKSIIQSLAASLALISSVLAGGALLAPAVPAQADAVYAAAPKLADKDWWTRAVIYEIYIRSFQDSNGDGIGDLNGITSRLDYLKRLGVDAIWITPFYPSPNKDFGYDVADYKAVSPEYGTMADFDRLVAAADRRGIRVLVDFVVNHTSDQHPWFQESRKSQTSPKRDWYIWRDGKVDVYGAEGPPNNWRSIFGGPAWTRDNATNQWYYHIFLPQQPDLNWRNPDVRKAMYDVMRFWLDHKVAGFRLDATPYLEEDTRFADDPDVEHGRSVGLKPYNSDQPGTHEILREMRKVVDARHAILLGESATATIGDLARVYGAKGDEINLPMNFLYGDLKKLDPAVLRQQIADAHDKLNGHPPVMFFSSHDHTRQWTQFGDGVHNDRIAKLTAAMTLAQPGVALIYYGEELGMPESAPETFAASPIGPLRPRADSRDGARTPMPWTSGPYGGFSTVQPWLAVDGAKASYNVQTEEHQPGSILNWYRALLALRREDPHFRDGRLQMVEAGHPAIIAFARVGRNGGASLVLLNASDQDQTIDLAKAWPGAGGYRLRLASQAAMAPGAGGGVRMGAYGVAIIDAAAAHCCSASAPMAQKRGCSCISSSDQLFIIRTRSSQCSPRA